jgi:RNase H-like domain found in reverse transcriptase
LEANRKKESGHMRRSAASATEDEEHGQWWPVAFVALKLNGGRAALQNHGKISRVLRFVFRKWRHLLDGETFEAVTGHMLLRLLVNLRVPHFRLAKWIVDIQMMAFSILHSAGDGEHMTVPDTMRRDFVDGQVLCHRYLEVLAEADDERVEESQWRQ